MAIKGLSAQQILEARRIYYERQGLPVNEVAEFSYARDSVNGNPLFIIRKDGPTKTFECIPINFNNYSTNSHKRLVVTKKEIDETPTLQLKNLACGRFSEITGIRVTPNDLATAQILDGFLVVSPNQNSMAFKGVINLPIKLTMPRS